MNKNIINNDGTNIKVKADMQLQTNNSIEQDLYQLSKESITSNALAVLITLSIVGVGIFIVAKKVTQFIAVSIVPDLKAYLSTQEKFIKAINSNSEEIKKNLINLESDSSSDHTRIINKLTEIELDVKEIKIIISKG